MKRQSQKAAQYHTGGSIRCRLGCNHAGQLAVAHANGPHSSVLAGTGTYLVPTFLPCGEIIRKSNIRLGYGTDLVAVYQPYENGQEYACWLRSERDPFRALKAATSVNASILGLENEGIVAPGMRAALAAWGRDLLHNEQALLDCAFVMKDGAQYKTECGFADARQGKEKDV